MSEKPDSKTGTCPEDWIDRSIRETKTEQREAEVSYNEIEDAESTAMKKLSEWTVNDVTDWLERKNLQNFIILFQKHHVCGKDLAELKLPFLENFENISVKDREILLSEIYNLLNPQTVSASEEDLTKIKSPVEKKKYFAAIEVAQDRNYGVPRASSVLTLPSHYSSVKSPSNQLSPKVKPRHKSESGSDVRTKSCQLERQNAETKKRKILPKTDQVETLFECLRSHGSQSFCSIELNQEQIKDIVFASDGEEHVTVEKVPSDLVYLLHKGDRIIEVNGYLVQPSRKHFQQQLLAILNYRVPAQIVYCSRPSTNINIKYEDEKWNKLHSMLVEMRDSDLPDEVPLPHPPESPQLSESFRSSLYIQEQNKKLEEKVLQQQKEIERLQIELEDKGAIMHDLELSRDKAVEKLKETRGKVRLKNSKESLGGSEYYNLTMNSLNIENAPREQVVESLKDIVKEASKQKWYLDRLISLVIEETPWLLDEVDSSLDNIPLTSNTEEFC